MCIRSGARGTDFAFGNKKRNIALNIESKWAIRRTDMFVSSVPMRLQNVILLNTNMLAAFNIKLSIPFGVFLWLNGGKIRLRNAQN